jgi:hypothetical protein
MIMALPHFFFLQRANLLKHEIRETTVLGRVDDDGKLQFSNNSYVFTWGMAESEQNPNIQVTVLIPW